jgi:hypothetical protein
MNRLALLWLCAAAGQSFAQSAMEARARRVIDQAIAALGGEKFLAMEDRIESGRAYSFFRDRLTGLSIATIYTRYISVAAGKTGEELGVRERQGFGKDEDFSIVFREDGGWEVTYRGTRPLDPERVQRYRDTTLNNFFYILHHRLREPGMAFESRGLEVVENVPVEVVDIIDANNRVVTVYCHQTTRLPVRQLWVWRDPKTRERNEEVTRFSRYRDVGGGVQWPHQILRERNGEKIYEMFADSVRINRDLTDDVFASEAPTRPKKR